MITPDVTDDSVPALRILGNLDRPFIDQLPLDRVDSLALAAPFFDPASAAVRELVTRFKPEQLIDRLPADPEQLCGVEPG